MSTAPSDLPQSFTYGDYLRWPDGERWELIGGVAYAMTPAPGVRHQAILFQMASQLGNWLSDKPCVGFTAPVDVRLPATDEVDERVETVVQPDLLVVCDRRKIDRRGIRGAPDFVLEVVSPLTAARDEITKAALYEKHGVREYWTLRPLDRLLTIRLLSEGRFTVASIVEARGLIPVTVLEGFAFDMDSVYDRIEGLVPEEP